MGVVVPFRKPEKRKFKFTQITQTFGGVFETAYAEARENLLQQVDHRSFKDDYDGDFEAGVKEELYSKSVREKAIKPDFITAALYCMIVVQEAESRHISGDPTPYMNKGEKKRKPRRVLKGANLCTANCFFGIEGSEKSAREAYVVCGVKLYEEYYELTQKTFAKYMAENLRRVINFVDYCYRGLEYE